MDSESLLALVRIPRVGERPHPDDGSTECGHSPGDLDLLDALHLGWPGDA